MISWNAQSISNATKLAELEILLRERDIHVACLQETYLNQNSKIYLSNYIIHRNDRLTHGGGVAIAVRRGIQHERLKSCDTNTLENITMAIDFHNKRIVVMSVYSPHYSSHFVNDLNKITTTSDECLILGDLNAKHPVWHCAVANPAGNALLNHLNTSDFSLHAPRTPTHYPHAGTTPSTMDLLLTNSSTPISGLCSLDDYGMSDHRPIFFQLHYAFETSSRVSYRYDGTNWNEFREFIDNRNLTAALDTPTDIDDAISRITAIILAARDTHTPTSVFRERTARVAPDTIQAIRYKNRLVRNWQRCIDPSSKARLKTAINIVGKMINDLIRRDRNSNWQSMLEKLDTGSKKYWRITRSLRGKRSGAPSTLRYNGNCISTNSEKADAFASIFERAHTTTLNNVHPHDRKVDHYIRNTPRVGPNMDAELLDTAELTEVIGSLRPFKAPGNDNMPNILLKQLSPGAIGAICNIYNACLSLNYWPASFKLAKITPIPKPGKDKGHAENYRPISLLNNLGKLFEKVIHRRIMSFVTENDILNAEQFGFRPQHSTSHQVLRVTNHIKRNRSQKKSTGMVLFDIEKAFDSVWHDGLTFKLAKKNFPPYLVRMVREFMADRNFEVHVFGSRSTPRPIPAGVPQGSILSPILYSIYVSDLKLDRFTDSACYADDTAAYTSANRTITICKRLQRSLSRIEKYYDKWKIKINPAKTQAIIFPFNNQRRRIPTTALTLGNIPIEYSGSVKYLGVTLDRKLIFREHIDQIRTKTARCMAALYPLIGRRSNLSVENKFLIFKAIIRPILTYASPIWIHAAISHRKNLQILQNKCLKLVLKLHWRHPTLDLHERAAVPMLSEYIAKLNANFNAKCATSDFNLIRELAL